MKKSRDETCLWKVTQYVISSQNLNSFLKYGFALFYRTTWFTNISFTPLFNSGRRRNIPDAQNVQSSFLLLLNMQGVWHSRFSRRRHCGVNSSIYFFWQRRVFFFFHKLVSQWLWKKNHFDGKMLFSQGAWFTINGHFYTRDVYSVWATLETN